MALPPGSTIGILGGGQLGRMIALAAAPLGYRCHVYDPHEAPCAADVAARFTRAAFDDEAALRAFAANCDVVTYEFENVPVEPLAVIGDKLRPGTTSLAVAQDRVAEKTFLEERDCRLAPWQGIVGPGDIAAALDALGGPVLLKTRRSGYDGKGQAWVHAPDEIDAAWDAVGRRPAVAEMRVAFDAEFSILLARVENGTTRAWNAPRNVHRDGILRTSTVPAGDPVEAQVPLALEMAERIAAGLGHIGVIAVEFFVTPSGPLVNEIAPRVHNSGHWTIEGAVTSQFEQHVRAICGLPLGLAGLMRGGAEMENLIGAEVERWPELVAERGAHVHLYGKTGTRPGRKMGHVTRVKR